MFYIHYIYHTYQNHGIHVVGCVNRITYISETGSVNRLHFSGTCVMHIWDRIRLVPDSGPIRTLFYSKPESGVHVTEIMTYDWSIITANMLVCFLFVIYR